MEIEWEEQTLRGFKRRTSLETKLAYGKMADLVQLQQRICLKDVLTEIAQNHRYKIQHCSQGFLRSLQIRMQWHKNPVGWTETVWKWNLTEFEELIAVFLVRA